MTICVLTLRKDNKTMNKDSINAIAQSTDKTRETLLRVSLRVTGLSESLLNRLSSFKLHWLIKTYSKRGKFHGKHI